MNATHVISDSLMEILKDATVSARERVEAAKVLLALGGWELAPEARGGGYSREAINRLVGAAKEVLEDYELAIMNMEIEEEREESWVLARSLRAAVRVVEDEDD